MKLAVARIRAESTAQVRDRIDMPTVAQYAEDMRNGASFPPLTIFSEDLANNFVLADGFHRLAAAKVLGVDNIEVNVLAGGPQEALLYALGCNATHGLRRTNADKNKAVQMALNDPTISKMSLREIASLCRVSHMTVSRARNKQSPDRHKQKVRRGTELQLAEKRANTVKLRKALKKIKAFPFDGAEVTRLKLNEDDFEALEYTADWLAKAVFVLTGRTQEIKNSFEA